ncbi:UDP-glucose dehydrogenase family protein [Paenibacillus sp. GCM10027627]|uniref:UDP-glucose 6-dehydrogenase TuaD n=1 Tax=unclassified Paenibacillus TaxID=185978 RepID=UPI0036426496
MRFITVIGSGYVGLVSGTCFSEIGNSVICCDIDEERIKGLRQGRVPFYEPGLSELIKKNTSVNRLTFTSNIPDAIKSSDIIYIAVGTPMGADGKADLTYIEAAAKTIGENLEKYTIIVNKSTVPVGTGEMVKEIINKNLKDKNINFDVVANPEFLREGSAIEDCMNMERAIIGSDSQYAAHEIKKLHNPFNTNVMLTDTRSAEMIKYASNGFLATKISYINAIANICEKVGSDINEVAKGMGMDSRIGSRFLQAGIGYGGSCFPKDTHALVHIAEKEGYEFELMKSVIKTNNKQRLTVIDKLVSILGVLAGKKIGILGLAFKPNTDDLRFAPSIDIINELHKHQAIITAYDPIATGHAVNLIQNKAEIHHDLYDTVIDCDACVILTEWDEIVTLDPKKLREKLRLPVIVDGRNCMDMNTMKENGFIYHSIGRPHIGSIRAKAANN